MWKSYQRHIQKIWGKKMNEDEKQNVRMLEFALFCADKHSELLVEFGEWKKEQGG